MHPRASALRTRRRIGSRNAIARDDPKQFGGVDPLTAAKTGSNGFHVTPIVSREPLGETRPTLMPRSRQFRMIAENFAKGRHTCEIEVHVSVTSRTPTRSAGER